MSALRPRNVVGGYALLAVAVAVRRELALPSEERTWTGTALGAPYDLRRPTVRRVLAPHLDPDGPLVGPQGWGVGWAVNLGALARRLGAPI